jgi:hypothetical protein
MSLIGKGLRGDLTITLIELSIISVGERHDYLFTPARTFIRL